MIPNLQRIHEQMSIIYYRKGQFCSTPEWCTTRWLGSSSLFQSLWLNQQFQWFMEKLIVQSGKWQKTNIFPNFYFKRNDVTICLKTRSGYKYYLYKFWHYYSVKICQQKPIEIECYFILQDIEIEQNTKGLILNWTYKSNWRKFHQESWFLRKMEV